MPSAVVSRDGTRTALHWGRLLCVGAVTVLVLVAGVWSSWGTAQYVMLTKGRERGTVAVSSCGAGVCEGRFRPVSPGARARERVVLEESVAVRQGGTYGVVLKPRGDEAVRDDAGGVLHAWVPLGGALLLSSVVVGGGLRRTRVAWALAAAGVALLTAAFVAL
jgi:hypothetical protein